MAQSIRMVETRAVEIEENIRTMLLHRGPIRLEGYSHAGGRWQICWTSELPPARATIANTGSWTVYWQTVETIYQALRARQVKRKPPGKATRSTGQMPADANQEREQAGAKA
jgi:hypothetical protein